MRKNIEQAVMTLGVLRVNTANSEPKCEEVFDLRALQGVSPGPSSTQPRGLGLECLLLQGEFPRRIRATRTLGGIMIDRRGFLSSFAGIAGSAGALGVAPKLTALLEQDAPKLPDSAL